jgi:mannose-6-phosphate isomerase-like protein (cupin superfamily)
VRASSPSTGPSAEDDLTFVEVQTGTYFGEDDIERLSDDYGRAG